MPETETRTGLAVVMASQYARERPSETQHVTVLTDPVHAKRNVETVREETRQKH